MSLWYRFQWWASGLWPRAYQAWLRFRWETVRVPLKTEGIVTTVVVPEGDWICAHSAIAGSDDFLELIPSDPAKRTPRVR